MLSNFGSVYFLVIVPLNNNLIPEGGAIGGGTLTFVLIYFSTKYLSFKNASSLKENLTL